MRETLRRSAKVRQIRVNALKWLCPKGPVLALMSQRSAPEEHDVYSFVFNKVPRSSGAQCARSGSVTCRS
jgi:hypothetical protein